MRILEAAVLYFAVVFGGLLAWPVGANDFPSGASRDSTAATQDKLPPCSPRNWKARSGGDTAGTDRWSNALVHAHLDVSHIVVARVWP